MKKTKGKKILKEPEVEYKNLTKDKDILDELPLKQLKRLYKAEKQIEEGKFFTNEEVKKRAKKQLTIDN